MRPILLASALALLSFRASAQQPSPDATSIMARVAANQDRSEAERAHYLYLQHAHVTSRKGKTVHCEELTDSRVTPSDTGSHQQLLKLDGRLLVKGKYVTYTQQDSIKSASSKPGNDDLNITIGGDDNTDRDLVENMRKNLTNSKSRDGFSANLFPLTTKSQADYDFTLLGSERINNRDVFHITFTYKDKSDFGWKGDAFIDTTAFQPVVIRTAMSRKIPFAVRTMLGTNLPGLGFTVIYAPQSVPKSEATTNPAPADQPATDPTPVWFPVSFGTEFKIKILFFFSREIVLSAENRDFERTHVTSTILPAEASTASLR